MPWELNVSAEAWSDLYRALFLLDKDRIIKALVEDMPIPPEGQGMSKWAIDAYARFIFEQGNSLNQHSKEVLAEMLYEQVCEIRTCSTGGHEVWLDGEGFNTLSWDEIDELLAEAEPEHGD